MEQNEQKWNLAGSQLVANGDKRIVVADHDEAQELVDLLNSYESQISELKKERDFYKGLLMTA